MVRKPGPEIEAAEIKRRKFVVIKLLPLDGKRSVKRARKTRRVGHADGRRNQDVRLLTAARQCHVRGVIKWSRNRRRERLIALHPFENLLFADIGVVRTFN